MKNEKSGRSQKLRPLFAFFSKEFEMVFCDYRWYI